MDNIENFRILNFINPPKEDLGIVTHFWGAGLSITETVDALRDAFIYASEKQIAFFFFVLDEQVKLDEQLKRIQNKDEDEVEEISLDQLSLNLH